MLHVVICQVCSKSHAGWLLTQKQGSKNFAFLTKSDHIFRISNFANFAFATKSDHITKAFFIISAKHYVLYCTACENKQYYSMTQKVCDKQKQNIAFSAHKTLIITTEY